VFEPLIKRKFIRKRRFLCFTAYNSKTFRIFAVLIRKQDVKPLFKTWRAKKEETNYEKECK
jgi:hypothetical protein